MICNGIIKKIDGTHLDILFNLGLAAMPKFTVDMEGFQHHWDEYPLVIDSLRKMLIDEEVYREDHDSRPPKPVGIEVVSQFVSGGKVILRTTQTGPSINERIIEIVEEDRKK